MRKRNSKKPNRRRHERRDALVKAQCEHTGRCPECGRVPTRLIFSATPMLSCTDCGLVWPEWMCPFGLDRQRRQKPLGVCEGCDLLTVRFPVREFLARAAATEIYIDALTPTGPKH